MSDVNTVQANFIAWLKTQSSLVNLLANSSEIRETEWQGTDFHYPNVRVSTAITLQRCPPDTLDITVIVFDEEKSSKRTNQIIGIITGLVQGKSFSYNTSKFVGLDVGRVDKADRGDENIWQATINITGMVS